MHLEEAAELFPDPLNEDEIRGMLADPDLDPTDRLALELILENI